MPRRDFLRAAGVAAGGVVVGGRSALGALAPRRRARRLPQGHLLDLQASDCPIDTIVVMMMENRSFDHYLGWLGTDEHYLERGKSRWGSKFTVDGKIDMTYVDAVGKKHKTHHLVRGGAEPHPFRGCGHPIPGHGWYAGRTELTKGFLAEGTGNDPYAIGYYLRDDVPVHAHLADRFTVHDRSFASLLRGHVPEPAVPLHRAVGRRAGRPGSAEHRDLPDADDLREADRRERPPLHVPHRHPDAAPVG